MQPAKKTDYAHCSGQKASSRSSHLLLESEAIIQKSVSELLEPNEPLPRPPTATSAPHHALAEIQVSSTANKSSMQGLLRGFTIGGLPILLSIISVIVAVSGASPIIFQAFVYKFKESPVQVDIMYRGANVPFNDEAMSKIDWWRLARQEIIDDLYGKELGDGEISGTVPQFRISEFGSTRGIYIDRVEFQQIGDDRWEPIADGRFVEAISGGRYLVNPSRFTRWPETTPGEGITDSNFLAAGRSTNTPFPFTAKQSDIQLEITVHTSVDADEIYMPIIGPLPRFIGRIRYKPVKRTYTVVS